MELWFTGEIFHWRGPSTFHFAAVGDPSAAIGAVASVLAYGWGAIPVEVRNGRTDVRTSLFPKDERYLVPIGQAVRAPEHVALGDEVSIRLRLDVRTTPRVWRQAARRDTPVR